VLDALAAYVINGYAAALPAWRRAINAARRETSSEEQLRCLYQAYALSMHIWDDESMEELSTRHIQLARAAGAVNELALSLTERIFTQMMFGELAAADSLTHELQTVTQQLQTESEAVGSGLYEWLSYAKAPLAAFRGDHSALTRLTKTATQSAIARGEGAGLTMIEWSNALLCNGLGRYADAIAVARSGAQQSGFSDVSQLAAAELVEAGARSGATDTAMDALVRLIETTSASGTDWALGVEARSRALLSAATDAESLYCEAIERLGRTHMRPDLARAHLLYGEWLRRERRRIEARAQLRIACDMFDAMGMHGFAERTRRELAATGETARKRTTIASGLQLTPQEEQIARLAGEGLTNPDIGARLFISAKTVQYHLGKVFTKLDISSRSQLPQVLPR
jgi:DNA-binding CsgD family transcriptional regulator